LRDTVSWSPSGSQLPGTADAANVNAGLVPKATNRDRP
jgi:hypothetical protein